MYSLISWEEYWFSSPSWRLLSDFVLPVKSIHLYTDPATKILRNIPLLLVNNVLKIVLEPEVSYHWTGPGISPARLAEGI